MLRCPVPVQPFLLYIKSNQEKHKRYNQRFDIYPCGDLSRGYVFIMTEKQKKEKCDESQICGTEVFLI